MEMTGKSIEIDQVIREDYGYNKVRFAVILFANICSIIDFIICICKIIALQNLRLVDALRIEASEREYLGSPFSSLGITKVVFSLLYFLIAFFSIHFESSFHFHKY